MDWTTIILALLSGTSVGGIFEAWRYRKQNKQLKENETTQSNVETQEKELNLLNMYKDEMLKLFDLMRQNQTENIGNQKEMMETLSNLDKRLDGLEERMISLEQRVKSIEESTNNLVEFNNGEFQRFVLEKRKKDV